MIVLQTVGGLGNQMFQYLAALQLAKKTDQRCCVDLRAQRKDKRRYELDHVLLKRAKKIPKSYEKSMYYIFQCYLLNFYEKYFLKNRIWSKLMWRILIFFGVFYSGIENYNIPQHILKSKKILMKGSFQAQKYHSELFNQLDKIFGTADRYLWLRSIEMPVCIHLRRGDYVGNSVHEVCDDRYYKNAIMLMEERVGKMTLIVFSDDIDYAKSRSYLKEAVFIDEKRGYKSMMMMKECTHFIISNSTFSWWGQCLRKNDDKIVIAPTKWFANGMEWQLYDDQWILVDVGKSTE